MKRLHLICNAHIDPVWQWTWDEGISSAIATFKSAADLAEEFDYIFCHNEAMLYEAIEESAPDLFARIQGLVKAGKWHITGGWYLQPDCNLPTGETFVRQISVGKSYFMEKFGVEPTVAYNFDAFGHSVGLPQLLAKNGYVGYMACRPNKHQFSYPGRFFKWTSPDGSSVIVTNSESYGTWLGEAVVKIKREVEGVPMWMLGSDSDGKERSGMEDVDYSLWGVGNHGGGPSRKDLRDIAELKIDGVEIKHSTPEALFAEGVNVSGEVNTSLITCMPGCYSSMARIKQGFRRAENMFYATEKMLAAASLNGISFDTSDMKTAEKKILFATFHDILPGTSVEEGEREGLCALSLAEKVARDYRTKVFLRMAMGQKHAEAGEFPVFVFNYAPYEVETPVEVEFMLENQNWKEEIRYTPHVYFEGKEIPCQTVKEESTLNLDWRKKVVFEGKLAPMSLTRFTIKVTEVPRTPMFSDAKEGSVEEVLASKGLGKPVFEVYDDTADPWGMSEKELKAVGENPVPMRAMTKAETKEFCALDEGFAAERIIEDGVILSAYEGMYTNGKSNAVLQVTTYKNQPYTDLKVTVEFAEKNKLLRVKIPLPEEFKNGVPVGDGPFVFEQKPNTECVFQKWFGVQNEKGEIFSILNDGVYAGKVEDGYIHLTLLRGAGYCFHPIAGLPLYPQDRYLPRIDGGRYAFNFRIMRGNVNDVYREAELFNQKPYAVNVFPTGQESKEFATVSLQGNVILTNCHHNEKGEYIIRLYNPANVTESFRLQVGGVTVEGTASKGEVVSVVVKDGVGKVVHDRMPV
ncbi:MAG: hypothetical protein IJX49_06875 [Clostridia bacterium]|nr:hypothetical protein [Clostridia bacterium]